MPFPYRKSLFFTPNASENASRTPGSLFEHGTHIPYHRWPSPVPNVRHRGRLPPQRSLAYILVDLLCATGLAAVSINPLRALAVWVSCNGAQQGVHITYKKCNAALAFHFVKKRLASPDIYLFSKHNRARIAKKNDCPIRHKANRHYNPKNIAIFGIIILKTIKFLGLALISLSLAQIKKLEYHDREDIADNNRKRYVPRQGNHCHWSKASREEHTVQNGSGEKVRKDSSTQL